MKFQLKLKTIFRGKGQRNAGTPENNYEQLERENKLVLSYLAVRKLIGLLGFFLPAILVIGSIIFGSCEKIQPSISNYYHTAMRDVFVGYTCALSIFLLSYKGYDLTDRIVSALAGTFGLILALLPTTFKTPVIPCNIECSVDHPGFIGTIHLVSAGLFLISLACFSLFLFTKGENNPTPEKLIRNKIYIGVAYLMFFCIGILILYFVLPEVSRKPLEPLKPVFWLETIAIMAFGLSWLVKGGLFFEDKT
ncbi:MAG: hypothetical protein IPM51_06950 [Sphingobacteriaceae bacterium]|nr:hypothetical protein [Sphingobacteriaceae bacterium]